jgi:hypothetical protein
MSGIIKHHKDFFSGLFFLLFGIAVMYIARNYDFGTARRMGPGYFPTVLGGILIAFSLLLIARSFFGERDPVDRIAVKPVFLILAGVLFFGLTIRWLGLPIAIIGMVLMGSAGSKASRPLPSVLLAVGLALFSVLVFVKGLGQPMPILGSAFGSWSR